MHMRQEGGLIWQGLRHAHGVELAEDVGRLPGALGRRRVRRLARVRARQLERHLCRHERKNSVSVQTFPPPISKLPRPACS